MRFKKIHKLSLKISLFVIGLFLTLFAIFYFKLNWHIELQIISLFVGLLFLINYFIIQHFVKQHITGEIERIYESSGLFTSTSIDKSELVDDLDGFFEKVNEVIDQKHQEVEHLLSRDDFRRDFLGNVSHELKTPLFTAQGYILTLLDDAFDDKALQKKYLQRANKSIERLDFIVKDLDMISKLESGMQLHYEPFNIVQLISEVFEMLEIKASKKNIIMTFDEPYEYPILVRADIERIEQVLINLLANSINYGRENGITTVSIQSHSKSQFLISISDNGIGIHEENIPRLFERFFRVDNSRSREQGGSGLGLAIVKHILEAHNQNITVESNYKKGSTFSFTLAKIQ